ncbi:MAG: Adenosine deaminase [Caulobacteraceae bacterium]|nr:Adenosine deaminase [Caulobacteraceae bacterium]
MTLKAILGGLALALTAVAGQAADRRGPDLAAMTAGELIAFTQAMPKGGELHNHISGSVYAETALAWAVEDGACVDVAALSLTPPCAPSANLKAAADVLHDEALRSALVDSLSTRRRGFRDRSGHDQFFGVFGREAPIAARLGDAIAAVMDDLARQNTFYLEAMVTPAGRGLREVTSKVTWTDDLPAMKAAMTGAGIDGLVPVAMAEIDAAEGRIRQVLKCGTPRARPGCQVTVRYLVQTSRILPPAGTFAQLQLGVALVAADRRWVGLQMVAPEDDPRAMANDELQMRMVDYLTDHGRRVPVALHAGELSLKLATPAQMSDHVAAAVRIAGARRIGHGTDLPRETGAEALAAEMAAKGVLVEVNLTSNAVILEVADADHPYAWLRPRGVPVSLSTDDAGILRIDLAHEYARAVNTGAAYDDLKRSARNALAFSFLAGEGLWADPGVYRRQASACAGQIGRDEPRPGPCAALVAASDKAREQWRHERLLARFEAARRSMTAN